MSEHFNRLTPAEAERLAILAEECGEVIQVVGKILRHGYNSAHPDSVVTNRELLEKEVGDLYCITGMMCGSGDLIGHSCSSYASEKREKIKKYLHHQEPAAPTEGGPKL